MEKLGIGSDHAGFELKQKLIEYLNKKGFEMVDFGTNSPESTDYPDYAHAVSDAVEEERVANGILICGSANGVCMTANKHQKVRCALAWNSEVAALAKQHNNANILALPARFLSVQEAENIVDVFLQSEFEGGRHEKRVNKISISNR